MLFSDNSQFYNSENSSIDIRFFSDMCLSSLWLDLFIDSRHCNFIFLQRQIGLLLSIYICCIVLSLLIENKQIRCLCYRSCFVVLLCSEHLVIAVLSIYNRSRFLQRRFNILLSLRSSDIIFKLRYCYIRCRSDYSSWRALFAIFDKYISFATNGIR